MRLCVSRPRQAGNYYTILAAPASAEVGAVDLALPITNNELAHLIWIAEANRRGILCGIHGQFATKRKRGRRVARIQSKALDIIEALRRKTREREKPD